MGKICKRINWDKISKGLKWDKICKRMKWDKEEEDAAELNGGMVVNFMGGELFVEDVKVGLLV